MHPASSCQISAIKILLLCCFVIFFKVKQAFTHIHRRKKQQKPPQNKQFQHKLISQAHPRMHILTHSYNEKGALSCSVLSNTTNSKKDASTSDHVRKKEEERWQACFLINFMCFINRCSFNCPLYWNVSGISLLSTILNFRPSVSYITCAHSLQIKKLFDFVCKFL